MTYILKQLEQNLMDALQYGLVILFAIGAILALAWLLERK